MSKYLAQPDWCISEQFGRGLTEPEFGLIPRVPILLKVVVMFIPFLHHILLDAGWWFLSIDTLIQLIIPICTPNQLWFDCEFILKDLFRICFSSDYSTWQTLHKNICIRLSFCAWLLFICHDVLACSRTAPIPPTWVPTPAQAKTAQDSIQHVPGSWLVYGGVADH